MNRIQMAKIYEWQFEVRGYELDSFGHVNHANYVHYLEQARWKLLEEEHIFPSDFDRLKKWPVISAIELKYRRPTFIYDKLKVTSQIVEHGRSSFVFEQKIYRKNDVVLEAKVHAVMVNEEGKPTLIPPEVKRLWHETDPGSGI